MSEQARLTVVIERAGEVQTSHDGVPGAEVARIIEKMTGPADATVMLGLDGRDERLLVAVDNGLAFIGLERTDGVFQFARPDAEPGTTPLTIGAQEADIETRYVVDLETAGAVIQEWVDRGEDSSLGVWERQ
jgi:hypothetical protein